MAQMGSSEAERVSQICQRIVPSWTTPLLFWTKLCDGMQVSGRKKNWHRSIGRVSLHVATALGIREAPCDSCPEDHSSQSSLPVLHCPRSLKLRRPLRSGSAQSGWMSSASTIARCRSTSAEPSRGPAPVRMFRWGNEAVANPWTDSVPGEATNLGTLYLVDPLGMPDRPDIDIARCASVLANASRRAIRQTY